MEYSDDLPNKKKGYDYFSLEELEVLCWYLMAYVEQKKLITEY